MGKSLSSKAKGGKAAAAQQSPAPAANKAAAAAEEETLFEQNEGVLARDSGELYEAKVCAFCLFGGGGGGVGGVHACVGGVGATVGGMDRRRSVDSINQPTKQPFNQVLRVSEATATTPRQYFIHYQGWNSKWDKWVDGDALLKVSQWVSGHIYLSILYMYLNGVLRHTPERLRSPTHSLASP